MAVLVSVVIPTYNRADFIARAIHSALEQRLGSGETEVIVVDDESTDATADVVQSIPGVSYIRQTNRREGAARNAGAALARGAYLAFLDSDDYWLAGKLAADVRRFEAVDRPALVYSRAMNVDAADRPIGVRLLPTPQGDVFWALAREAFMPMSSVVVRADAFRACGGFVEDRKLSGTADWELWLRLAARWPVGFVDQTATCIRVHEHSMLADPAYMQPAMLAGVEYALRDAAVVERLRGHGRWLRACMYVTIALSAYRHHDRPGSLAWLARAAIAWPPQMLDPRFLGALSRTTLGPGLVGALHSSRSHARKLA